MFSWRNKKDISIFRMKKAPYLLLCTYANNISLGQHGHLHSDDLCCFSTYSKYPHLLNSLFCTCLPKFCCFYFLMFLFHRILGGMANSVDTAHTAPSGFL